MVTRRGFCFCSKQERYEPIEGNTLRAAALAFTPFPQSPAYLRSRKNHRERLAKGPRLPPLCHHKQQGPDPDSNSAEPARPQSMHAFMSSDKSTVEEIRARFDREVERYAHLETGQTAVVDSRLALDLIQRAALRVCPQARTMLDLGCGAGNYSLKLREVFPDIDITLVDLSQPMLHRALQRLGSGGTGTLVTRQGDVRELELGKEQFDIIVAAMVLHHLRADTEWESVYDKLWGALKPGGALWVTDFVDHTIPEVHQLMWERYGDYLTGLKDTAYRDYVFAYVTREDTPRPLLFQIDQLRAAGFHAIDLLHKNTCFAVFGALKSGT
jgi:tRNA (cmo5U34)-methyltransferase